MRRLHRFALFALLVSLPFVALGLWIGSEIRAASIPIDSPFHPFRSEEARERFLAEYDELAASWPVPAVERTLETSWGATLVRTSGPPDALPLLLIHGIGGSSLQWLPNVADLSRRFRVHAVDAVYDKGRSVPSRRFEDAGDLQSWLDEVVDGLEPDRPLHLVGLSYGGWLSARFAIRRPERVRGLVLLAPVATVRPLAREWMGRAVLAALPFRIFTEQFVRWLAADLARAEDGRERIREHVDFAFLANRSFKPVPVIPPDVLSDEELAALPDATLVIVGENEKIYDPRRVIERLRRVAPQVETVLLEDCGHDLTLVRPVEVDRRIVEFLGGRARVR